MERKAIGLRSVFCIPLHTAEGQDTYIPPLSRYVEGKEDFFMKKGRNALKTAKIMTLSAMLVAMSVVIGIFCKSFMNFSMGLFRITFENLPIILSGILFGPWVGGAVGICSDVVSYLFSGQVYPLNPIVSLGALAVGVVSGIMAKYVVRKRGTAQIIVSAAAAHVVGSMIIKPIGLYQFYGVLVLWRIPLYVVIATLEILVLCLLFRRSTFRRLIDKHVGDSNEL